MLNARWQKLLGDLRAERGRLILMVSAILVSLIAIVVVLGAQTVLQREIAANYLGTRPASATFELSERVDQGLLEGIRTMPEVATATGREVARARIQVGDDWRPMLIFVAEDFNDLRLNLFYRESGAWPPPTGTVLLERSALSMAEADLGSTLRVMAPNGSIRALGVSGVVHDPGLAPAWQERSVYAYATPATLVAMGESPALHELRIAFRAETKNASAVQIAADELSQALKTRGLHVQEIRIPPPGEHPHQRQMTTVLSLLLTFAGLALVLSSVLVATSLAAMLARQVREIGVMKAVGATTGQLAMMYGVVVTSIGLCSVAISVPIGLVGARAFAANIAKMLNFNLSDRSVPLWVLFVALASGLVVPLVIAAVPISRATRMSVRAALEQHGASPPSLSTCLLWLPRALRDAMRRPSRFVLTVGLLATGGALFMTSLAVSKAWVKNVDKIYESRFYDVEIRLRTTGDSVLVNQMQSLPGVGNVELWDYGPAAFARPGRVDLVHTYPDRGHGSLSVMAPPVTTELVRFPLLAGRWLLAADDTGVVLNHVAAAQRRGIRIGDEVLLSMGGHVNRLRLVGIVEEVGSPGIAYVTHRGFLGFGVPESSGRLVRLATVRGAAGQRAVVVPRIEGLLAQRSVGVESVIPFAELRTAIGDHIAILTRALVAMAVVLAIVGILGLGSAMGTSVVERTRDIGVMKVIGGTSSRIIRAIVAEGLATAAASYLVAVVLSLPLTWVVQGIIGRIGFLAPLPFVLSPAAILGWAGLLGLSTLAATLPPAYRAAALSVRDALAVTG